MTQRLDLVPIRYEDLNARQQENYNFQKVSALLADYGFKTMRLSDDWQGADFIAYHNDGELFLKVQLKGRLGIDRKYVGKDIWIAFRRHNDWYLYPHDDALSWALENLGPALANGWGVSYSSYTWPSPSKSS